MAQASSQRQPPSGGALPPALAALAELSPDECERVVGTFTAEQAGRAFYDWRYYWARPCYQRADGTYGGQLPPDGDWWTTWLVLAGRGYGKTRMGAEWVIEQAQTGRASRIALVARSSADAVLTMIEGESGILARSPPWFRPIFHRARRELEWPNGAMATYYYAESPDMLRGPQHDAAWADELAAWQFLQTWDNLMFGLRLGEHPRVCITTTPRPLKLLKRLLREPTTAVTTGSTYENRGNLAPTFFAQIVSQYEGTRLGEQELNARILDDDPNALWSRDLLEATRVTPEQVPPLLRVVVAVDPEATSDGEDSAETGIIVAGLGANRHGYILDDVSLRATPDKWGRAAVAAYHKWRADRMVGETNQGGEMVEFTVRTVDPDVSFKGINARVGKRLRAEPIAALYEQRRVHHVGLFSDLEEQQTNWVATSGQRSPDRLDAAVHALTELMLTGHGGAIPMAAMSAGDNDDDDPKAALLRAITRSAQFGASEAHAARGVAPLRADGTDDPLAAEALGIDPSQYPGGWEAYQRAQEDAAREAAQIERISRVLGQLGGLGLRLPDRNDY